ncbi:hypothetical protein [Streptomyces sp. NPDC048659]|uniref:hypothetical protein n=1 Tax=Streptomyces sp. NPDC048659 TaxID=3155489 RepID=UPI00343A77FB
MTPGQARDWAGVTAMSVPAAGLVPKVEALFDGDAGARGGAEAVLYVQVANQGQLYSAAAPCVDLIAELARERGRATAEAVSVLEAVLNARTPGLTVTVGGAAVDAAGYCRRRILELLPLLLDGAAGAEPRYLRELFFLLPQLADSAPGILGFLREREPGLDGEALTWCREALEEAADVLRDGHMP